MEVVSACCKIRFCFMKKEDLHAIIGEHYLDRLEQTVCCIPLTLTAILINARAAQSSLKTHLEQTQSSPEEFLDGLSVDTIIKQGLLQLIEDPYHALSTDPMVLMGLSSRLVFLWQRLRLASKDNPLWQTGAGILHDDMIPYWNEFFPGMSGMGGTLIRAEANDIRDKLSEVLLQEHIPDTSRLSAITKLFRPGYEQQTMTALVKTLFVAELYRAIQVYYATLLKGNPVASHVIAHAERLIQLSRGWEKHALEQLPAILFGLRIACEVICKLDKSVALDDPFNLETLSSWQLLGGPPPASDLAEKETISLSLFPRIHEYIAGL